MPKQRVTRAPMTCNVETAAGRPAVPPVSRETTLRSSLAHTRQVLRSLIQSATAFDMHLQALEAQDQLGKLALQDVLDRYKARATLAAHMLKQREETAKTVIQNL